MDNYKFGNELCKRREAKGLTQKDFAKMLDVSDKAVSKWENGQAIPRMDTFEKIAEILDTTVEELIISGKNNVKRVLVKNEFGTTLHIEVDNEIISFKANEEKWLLLDNSKSGYKVIVYGDTKFHEIVDEFEPDNTTKDKIKHNSLKLLSKWVDERNNEDIIKIKCIYTVSNVVDGEYIVVKDIMFSAGDKMWIGKELSFSYPKLECGADIVLTNAECTNRTDVLYSFRHYALTSELGISIPLMLIAYPFRKIFFKTVITSKGLMKYIDKSDYYVAMNNRSNERNKKRKHPFLWLIGFIPLLIIAWLGVSTGIDIITVESDKPYLVSNDFSTITYSREVYIRTDDLPKDTISDKLLGAEVWYDARIDGYSKSEQYFNENKVCEFIDKNGNKYLWLVPDYFNTIINEKTGDYKEYDDLNEHYVYKLIK